MRNFIEVKVKGEWVEIAHDIDPAHLPQDMFIHCGMNSLRERPDGYLEVRSAGAKFEYKPVDWRVVEAE
jgi:hypothetical protein